MVPAQFRDEARIEADVRGKSVTIHDCRPPWNRGLTEWSRVPVAQLRYAPESNTWMLHWADRNSRWHLYDGIDPGTVDDLLAEVEADPTCIFEEAAGEPCWRACSSAVTSKLPRLRPEHPWRPHPASERGLLEADRARG